MSACAKHKAQSRREVVWFRPLRSFVIPAELGIAATVVIPAKVVIPKTVVIPAQAGIHGCACRRSSCRDGAVPASREAATERGLPCDRATQRTGASWRSTAVAAKPRAPGPKRFTGAVSAAPERPAMPGSAAASRNALRSLRSNSRDESVDALRRARGRKPWPCRLRRLSGPAARQVPTVHRTVGVRGSPCSRTRGALQPGRTRLCREGCGVRDPGARTPANHKRSGAPGGTRRGRFLGR